MAFISACPKCQKSVLVPEGHGHDAVVQCPACSAEYSLGEILASIPALIVVHPGGGAAAVEVASLTIAEIAPLAEQDLSVTPAVSGDGTSAAQPSEPALGDSDALDFVDDAAAMAAAADNTDVAFAPESDHAADSLFAAAFAEEAPPPSGPSVAPLTEPLSAPADGEGEASVAGSGEKTDEWGGFGEEAAGHGAPAERVGSGSAAMADDTIDLAAHEEDGDGSLAHIDFASITGMSPAAAAAAGDAAMVFEAPKKKRRKREANMLVRFVGIVISGLLAVGCVYLFATWRDIKLPDWLKLNWGPKQSAAPKLNSAPAPSKAEIPAGGANTQSAAATTSDADAGKTSASEASPGGKPNVPAKPVVPASPSPDPAPSPKTGSTGLQPKGKPRTPASDEGATPTDPIASAPESDEVPPLSAPGKGDLTAPAVVAPVMDKPKPEIRNKPEVTDPFATPSALSATAHAATKAPAAAPKTDAPKTEKPSVEPKPETPPTLQPELPAKPELPNKAETTDPFATPDTSAKPQTVAPKIEKPKIEKPGAESKPDLSIPGMPETAPKFKPPVIPELAEPEPVPDEVIPPPLITPLPARPKPVKPEPKPEVKPVLTVGPVGAPTIPAAQLDSALTRIGAAAHPAFGDLCQLAEAATFVQGASAAQKQALRDAVKKLASNSQEVSRLAAEAKKRLDDKATKGGIALSGKVSKVASKNGLFGMAVRIEGMSNAVMVFSSHPLDVKEGDSVIVLGALVSEPAKNLPGYTGKQPVVVWADLAAPTP